MLLPVTDAVTSNPPSFATPAAAPAPVPGAAAADALHQAFPTGFIWGVATAAFQIEGAGQADGKGESIWDRFCRQPGTIADGSNGDVACDHVGHLDADLDLIAGLGVDAYRFSVSWPRVQPQGRGAWNEAGLAFYERLIDGLRARGIAAHLTLNHWDLPQALQDAGGWAARETVHHFVDYARGMARRFGDRLASLTTHNEPWVIAVLGHEQGIFAPGLKDRGTALRVGHHLLLSHGLSLQALRAEGAKVPLGIVLNLAPVYPATESAADLEQARIDDLRGRRWLADPLFDGTYPAEIEEEIAALVPDLVQPGDLAAIAQPLDFLGINYYSRHMSSADRSFDPARSGLPLSDMGWEVYAPGLTDLLLRMHDAYALPPVLITENGMACRDEVVDGRVDDAERTAYLQTHIAAVAEALRQGVPMAGYMVWSLLDNFEWASGYAKRFGIVHVDYTTLQRTPKDSAHWYRDFVARCRAARSGQPG